jgi:hypothetical protein
VAAAAEFIRSFPAATELVLVGSSREAVDDLVRGLARTSGATFGLHRFSLTQFAARLAIGKLAAAGVAPSSAVGAEALAVRAAYEAAMRNELPYFAPVTKFPGSPAQRLPPSATCVRPVLLPKSSMHWRSPAPMMPLCSNVFRSRWRKYRSPTAPSFSSLPW